MFAKPTIMRPLPFLFAISLAVLATSCRKDLDLSSGAYFGVKEFIRSANCAGPCGEQADCEGEYVGLEGVFDESNILEETNTFYVLDANDEDERLEVRVDPLIASEVFSRIRFRMTNEARVRGDISGYDQQMNLGCNRGFILAMTELEDLEVN